MDAIGQGHRIGVPEIADYELRRELLRADKRPGLARLDEFKGEPSIEYLPLTTEAMLEAARLWAHARTHGFPTAPDQALDGDVILVAQALLAERAGAQVVVAAANVGHLDRFEISARLWQEIR